jgi:hypothetical protein
MVLSVGCTLANDVLSPAAKFTLKILENSDLCQQLVDEGIRVFPDVPIGERTATSKGSYVWQLKKGSCRDLHPPVDRPVSRPHHPGAPLGRLRDPARPMDVRAGSDAYIGGQWDRWIRPMASHQTGSRWSPAAARGRGRTRDDFRQG